jgi:hypothetical protein
VDGSYVYAAGGQVGNGRYDYKSGGVSATGKSSITWNALVVQYDDNAQEAQWAVVQDTDTLWSTFNGIAADGLGNIYAAGGQESTGTFTYGGASAQGSGGINIALIVKFDSDGHGLWARAATGSSTSLFKGVAVDGSGGVYAVGNQAGIGTYTYSPSGASATGTYSGGTNSVIVHYDSTTGAALWAKSITSSSYNSAFYGVAADGQGTVYAAGFQRGSGAFNYGGASTTGSYTLNNAVVVHYDSATGAALWAKAATGGGDASVFNGVATDGLGNFTAAGYQTGGLPFNYGGVSATGGYASGTNAVAVGWR